MTNQACINKGLISLDDYYKLAGIVHDCMLGAIDKTFTCEHRPDENCDCRKPKTDYFRLATLHYDIDFSASYLIGDADIDIQAAQNIGACPILVETGRGKDFSHAAMAMNVTVVPDVMAAAEFIIERERRVGAVSIRSERAIKEFHIGWDHPMPVGLGHSIPEYIKIY